jgi:hypothetical protein
MGKRKKWDCQKANCWEIAGKEKNGEKEHRTPNIVGRNGKGLNRKGAKVAKGTRSRDDGVLRMR